MNYLIKNKLKYLTIILFCYSVFFRCFAFILIFIYLITETCFIHTILINLILMFFFYFYNNLFNNYITTDKNSLKGDFSTSDSFACRFIFSREKKNRK